MQKEISRDAEDERREGLLVELKEIIMSRTAGYDYPIIGVRLSVVYTRRNEEKDVFRVYLAEPFSPEQQKASRKTFRGYPLVYEVVGNVTAGRLNK